MSFPEALEPEPDDPHNDVVLITDASIEGEEVASLLRARGFVVVDVPLGLLDAHYATEPPRVLILDVDQPRAIETARRLRATPAGPRVNVLCVGDPLRAGELFVDTPGSAASLDNVFERPVDIQRLADRVGALATPSGISYSTRGTTPPPMYAPRASLPPPASDRAPPISEFPRSNDPLDAGLLPSLEDGEGLGPAGVLSPDLAHILARAELNVANTIDKLPSSPANEDADCALPPDMLAPLDEPLDPLEEEHGTGSGGDGTGSPQVLAWVEGVSSVAGGGTGSGTGTGALGISPAAITSSGIPLLPSTSTIGARSQILPTSMLAQSNLDNPTGARSSSEMGLLPSQGASHLRGDAAASSAGRGTYEPSAASAQIRASELAASVGPSVRSQGSGIGARLADLAAPVETTAAPVRFQEARVVAEGRASMALAFEERMRPMEEERSRGQGPSTEAHGSAALRGRTAAEQRLEITNADGPTARRTDIAGGYADARKAPGPSRTNTDRGAVARDSATSMPMVFAEMEGGKPLARAIADRYSGSLAFTSGGGVRRMVLQDGDVVTAGSEIADESLVSFLAARGDIDREIAGRLAGKLPASGRHAGAALIAQGHLAQDQLWPVLRAHAEWLIGRAIAAGPGTIEPEDEAPGRLRAEPSVFGGATGAEVFVEMMRRVVPASFALAQLGGPDAHFDQGKRPNLLGECALSDAEQAVARSAPGHTVGALSPESDGDLVVALWALVELGVLGVIAPARRTESVSEARVPDLLDEEAIRQRVRARSALVREGDYFSLLGVTRSATSYELKRAYLELRRAFEPSRLLTAGTVDLIEDVELINEVIDEAYEILRDANRRERYRRAIDAMPMD